MQPVVKWPHIVQSRVYLMDHTSTFAKHVEWFKWAAKVVVRDSSNDYFRGSAY